MIDLDQLERLAKDAAETGVAGHRIKFFMNIDPESVLALIAEVRALREDAERYRWLRSSDHSRVYVMLIDSCRSIGVELDTKIDAARGEK